MAGSFTTGLYYVPSIWSKRSMDQYVSGIVFSRFFVFVSPVQENMAVLWFDNQNKLMYTLNKKKERIICLMRYYLI